MLQSYTACHCQSRKEETDSNSRQYYVLRNALFLNCPELNLRQTPKQFEMMGQELYQFSTKIIVLSFKKQLLCRYVVQIFPNITLSFRDAQ